MKVGVFAYNFKHKKTQEGLLALFLQGFDVKVVMAADPVELKFYQSKIRVGAKDLEYIHPEEISKKLGMEYRVVKHNSEECEKLIKENDLDIGIILGARILKQPIIDSFKIGVLNMHPGLLPENRGLDNLKWAILQGYKQGVSCHLISKEIDKGSLILKREINVYEDDSLVDIFLRLQNMEQTLMVESLRILAAGKREFERVSEGNYRKCVPPELEAGLLEKFEEYKKKYREL
jgi:methionyl-tRNA formyltransferase